MQGFRESDFKTGHISSGRERAEGYRTEGVKQHRRKWRSSVEEMLNTLRPSGGAPDG